MGKIMFACSLDHMSGGDAWHCLQHAAQRRALVERKRVPTGCGDVVHMETKSRHRFGSVESWSRGADIGENWRKVITTV